MSSTDNEILTEAVRMVTECFKRLEHDVHGRQSLRVEEENFPLRMVGLKLHIKEAYRQARQLADMAEKGPTMSLGDRDLYERIHADLMQCSEEIRHFRIPDGLAFPDCGLTLAQFLSTSDIARATAGAAVHRGEAPTDECTVCLDASLNSIRDSIHQAATLVRRLAELASHNYQNHQYEELVAQLTERYGSPGCDCWTKGRESFLRWKNQCLDDPANEWQALFASRIKALLDSGFIVVDDRHETASFRSDQDLLAYYLHPAEITEERQKKFHVLCRLVEHRNGRFHFTKPASFGKYLHNNRHSLSADHIEGFFAFMSLCTMVYQEYGDSVDRAWAQEQKRHTAARKEAQKQTAAGAHTGKRAGRPSASLFAHQKDALQEAVRLKCYLSDHNMLGRCLDSTAKSPLNDVVVCFLVQWRSLGLLSDGCSGASVYRFLTTDCGLRSTVKERAYANKVLADWLKNGLYTEERMQSVKGRF